MIKKILFGIMVMILISLTAFAQSNLDLTEEVDEQEVNISLEGNETTSFLENPDNFINKLQDYVQEPVTQKYNLGKIWFLIVLLAIIYGAILWDKKISKDEGTNWFLKIFGWFILVILTTILIVLFIRWLL